MTQNVRSQHAVNHPSSGGRAERRATGITARQQRLRRRRRSGNTGRIESRRLRTAMSPLVPLNRARYRLYRRYLESPLGAARLAPRLAAT